MVIEKTMSCSYSGEAHGDIVGASGKGCRFNSPRLDFDRRLMLQFRGSVITSDGGLLAYRELDDALALTASGGERLAEARTGKNRRHFLVGLLRQSVFGRLAGYEDVNDADRLCRDPAMRWVVGGRGANGPGCLGQPDGPLRDRVAGATGEPRCPRRPAGLRDWGDTVFNLAPAARQIMALAGGPLMLA
jgi:hypothetical protein